MEQEVLDAPITSQVAVYNPIAAGIALMLEKHGHVLTHPPIVTGNAQALTLAKAGRKELITFRTTLEKARKAEKAESLAYGRLVDSEAARIQAFADPLELAYDSVIVAEEDRLEAIRQQELEAERQRIAGHRARIAAIKEVRETAAMCRTADRLKQLIDGMPAHLEQPFEEFQGEAETAFNETCTALQQMHGVKVEAEAQAAELARQQAELAAQRAEADRVEAARQATAKAEADAQAKKLSDERQAFERQQAEARAAQQAERDAEEERQRIQRAAFQAEQDASRAAQQAEDDRIAKERRDLADAQHAEANRLAAEELAAKQKHLDEEAAAERSRQDAEAAAVRAEADRLTQERADKAQAEYDALMKAAADLKRLHDAAPALLAALEMVRDADNDCRRDGLPTIPTAARAKIDAAIALATE